MGIELVVGLGNPGEEHAGTRHNVGFRVVDEVARRLRAGSWERRHSSEVAVSTRGPRVWLARPRTFMNRSGMAVASLLEGLGVPPSRMLVIVDDVDLPMGRIRLRPSGGPGTHNGLRDIVDRIGPGFARLRLGVRGETPWNDLAEYVLSPFDEEEQPAVEEMIKLAADAVTVSVFEGLRRAMNRFNQPPVTKETVN